MKYPSINKQPTRSINIPELSGGLNLRDGISAVNDNQLTDCKNIWFKDAILKTRPGMALDALLEFDTALLNLRVWRKKNSSNVWNAVRVS